MKTGQRASTLAKTRLIYFLKNNVQCIQIGPTLTLYDNKIKGSSDPSHFIFEIKVGKSRSMSDPTLSDIDFKNKTA